MGGESGGRWAKVGVIIAGAALVVTVVGVLLAFVIGYTSEEAFRGWVSGVVGRWGLAMVAVGAAAVLVAVGVVLAKFHEQVVRPFRSLAWVVQGCWRGARACLARRLVSLAEKVDPGDVENGARGWLRGVAHLEYDEDLEVLAIALSDRDLYSSGAVEIPPEAILAEVGVGSRDCQVLMLARACDRLARRGYLDRWDQEPGGEVVVWVAEAVADADQGGEISRLVRSKMGVRG
jgi:hypothetical protein